MSVWTIIASVLAFAPSIGAIVYIYRRQDEATPLQHVLILV
jgi:hypothetical protein